MIEIQKQFPDLPEVDEALLTLAIETALQRCGQEDSDLTLRLTSDAEIQELNRTYRDEPKPTDVLSFNQDFTDPETGRLYRGDLIISVETASMQAAEQGHNLDEECAFLAIHGTLHLLGYDHYDPEEKAEMWALQDLIFNDVIERHNSIKRENK